MRRQVTPLICPCRLRPQNKRNVRSSDGAGLRKPKQAAPATRFDFRERHATSPLPWSIFVAFVPAAHGPRMTTVDKLSIHNFTVTPRRIPCAPDNVAPDDRPNVPGPTVACSTAALKGVDLSRPAWQSLPRKKACARPAPAKS